MSSEFPAGAGNELTVIGVVYVDALAPDSAEGSGDMLKNCSRKGLSPIHSEEAGRRCVDPDVYPEAWAWDLDIAGARALAAVERAIATQSFMDKVTQAAWRTKLSWFQISTKDMERCAGVQPFMAKRIGAVKE